MFPREYTPTYAPKETYGTIYSLGSWPTHTERVHDLDEANETVTKNCEYFENNNAKIKQKNVTKMKGL